jgi:hypothetical protein
MTRGSEREPEEVGPAGGQGPAEATSEIGTAIGTDKELSSLERSERVAGEREPVGSEAVTAAMMMESWELASISVIGVSDLFNLSPSSSSSSSSTSCIPLLLLVVG